MLTPQQLLSECVRMAKIAGKIQIGYFRSSHLKVDTKYNDSDVVTEADKRSEAAIIAEIRRLFPTHSVLSEESGEDAFVGEYRWVIDPLDGTASFSSGLPGFCVSIGVEHKGQTVAGVVYAPYLGELFTATKGGGAYLNGELISPRQEDHLSRAMLATGFPVDRNTNNDCNVDNFLRLLPLVRDIRRMGSAALDICYVAAGLLDGYWEMNLHDWDVSAALLIAQESGAEIDRFRHDRNVSVIVASSSIMPKISPMISRVPYNGTLQLK